MHHLNFIIFNAKVNLNGAYIGVVGHFYTSDAKMKRKLKNSTDTAVFTTKFVLEEKKAITYVTHEIEDGAWQFFSDDKFDNFENVAKIVGLTEILEIDPTLTEIMSMEVGHVATRKNKGDKWTIKRVKQ